MTPEGSPNFVPVAEREWAYDRKSHVGRLDKTLGEAKTKGWTMVDMKKDWKRVFPIQK